MAAEYDLIENPNTKGDETKQPLHPRIVVKGKITTERLIRDITQASTLTAGDVVGALRILTDRLSFYISEGYNVELGEIGNFTAKLKARSVMDKKEIRAASISFDGVNFRPTIKFKRSIQGELTRAPYGFKKSSKLSLEERKKLLEEYFEKNIFITRKEYTLLTGRLQKLALKDLNQWVEEGYLQKKGKKSTTMFMKVND